MPPNPDAYDDETRAAAKRWVEQHHQQLERGETWNRLYAEACAQIHLANTGRWKP